MRLKEIARAPLVHLNKTKIVDVWAHNFVQEMKEISYLIEEFNIIAMDTEFPGVEDYQTKGLDDKENEYHQIVENVKNFKLIQIGLSLANDRGEVLYYLKKVPTHKNTWQFHLKFRVHHDKIVGTVQQLLEKAGIDFRELEQNGIDQDIFCDYLTGSGLILNEDVKFIVFHGQFDFGGLPEKSDEFVYLMKIYFPGVLDLKYAIRDNVKFKDVGLSKLAIKLDVNRIGPEHQAGSDALLTLQCYVQMKNLPEFEQELNSYNVIYGIGKGYVQNTRRKQVQTPEVYYDYQQYDQQYYDPMHYGTYGVYQQYNYDDLSKKRY